MQTAEILPEILSDGNVNNENKIKEIFFETVNKALDEMKEKDPIAFMEMQKKVTAYFNIYKKQLENMYEEGLIASDDYKHFKTVGKYSPRQYLKFFDLELSLLLRQSVKMVLYEVSYP